MGFAAMSIFMVMVIPIPAMLLDLFLSFNITLPLIILLVGMYILNPLDLSSFPSLLLLSTLFRLSLNVASTRMILLNGNEGTHAAGKVIMAFGNFVVGGNYLVGFDRVCHPRGDQFHGDHQGCRQDCRSGRPLHLGRHAR
jgi:flagellar biosynthesis protein FlhA